MCFRLASYVIMTGCCYHFPASPAVFIICEMMWKILRLEYFLNIPFWRESIEKSALLN